MSTFGIVALSLLAGLFLAIIVGGLAAMIWYGRQVKLAADALAKAVNFVHAETGRELAEQLKAITAVLESAKSNFQGIRDEMRKSQSITLQETRDTLEAHRVEMDKMIQTINGVRFIDSAKKIDKSSAILWKVAQKLEAITTAEPEFDDTEGAERARAWPAERAEEYAPAGETIYDHTRVVKVDQQVEQEEALGTE